MSPHDSGSQRQLILDFESGLADRFESALDVVRACAYRHGRPLKSIAADMDLSQSDLSRKLSENPDDPRRFTIGDLERFVRATGDCTVIYYLVEKFIEADEMKQRRALAELVSLAPRLAALIKQAGG